MASRAILLITLVSIISVGVDLADDATLLTGSDEKIADALSKSDVVFVGKITGTGNLDTKSDGAGYEHYSGVKMKVSQVLRGWFDPQVQVNLVTLKAPINVEEFPPEIGSSYIFFIQRFIVAGRDLYQVRKLLPATAENISKVKKLVTERPKT